MMSQRSVVHVSATMLRAGDVIAVAGSYQHVKSAHQPGTDWNPHTTVVRVCVTGVGWLSMPRNNRVQLIT